MNPEVRFSPDQKRIFTQLEWLLEQTGNAYADFIEVVSQSSPQVDSAFEELRKFIEAIFEKMQQDSSFVPMEAIMANLNDRTQQLIDLMAKEKKKISDVEKPS